MTFEVKLKKWHAIASWTWNAGDDVAESAGCHMTAARPMGITRVTTAQWCGDSAATPSTCSASRSGSSPRQSSVARCAAGSGSLRPPSREQLRLTKQHQHQQLAHPVPAGGGGDFIPAIM
eukprot:CAMPEP_0117680654 /NCGR_PEP_ID=MMETSP0804-20121206/18486_1 /TAXON_ID=1074897 /ORGANISM="Tetraselmis astigmatica, Strain CCMP880" /LENGTH=119 /DNA_ID=CAMNT_0005490203 /DNA_START=379 /DNA_END=739 /DNA_ORIENTATION=-